MIPRRSALVFALGLLSFATKSEAQPVIAFLGDSLTAGLGVAMEESYPALLEAELRKSFPKIRILNAGISGDTTSGGLRRVDWILRQKPDWVWIGLGANDMLRGIPAPEVRANLLKIIQKVRKSGAHAGLLGMRATPNLGKPYRDAFDRIYAELSKSEKIPLDPFLLEGVAANQRLNQADGIHPTAEAHRAIAQRLAPLILNELKKSK